MKIVLTIVATVILAVAMFRPQGPEVVSNGELKPEIPHVSVSTIPSLEANNLIQNALPEKLKSTSLKGTTIDGLYPVDENGNLMLSKDIKQRFEYFLSTMGEFELDDVLAMIKEDISLNLSSPAREQASKLFDDYVAYKFALSELEASLDPAESYELNDISRMRMQLEKMREVRREYLSLEAVDAFFGFDEMYDDFMLASLEIKNNTQLTQLEKHEQLKSLESSLPEDVREMRDETQRISQVFLLTEEMKKEGSSESEIYELNEKEFGQAAAERLKKLNENRNQWQNRVDHYLSKKMTIMNNDDLSVSEKDVEIETLKRSSFLEKEYSKLSAYELMSQEANPK